MTTGPTFAQLLLAFRQAKNAISAEKGVVGLFGLAHFEMQIHTRIQNLQTLLTNDRWFDLLEIGGLVVMPKATEPISMPNPDIVRIGGASPAKQRLSVRLQLEPSPEFAITEVIYLWEFGGALESLLNSSCVGYRLKRVREDGGMDCYDRSVYEYWPAAFDSYRDDPIEAARSALHEDRRVIVVSTDVVSFFDSIDPMFLLEDEFITDLAEASNRLKRPFSDERYRTATRSLLRKFEAFRHLRRIVGGVGIDTQVGVPIGALTSRVFANVALSSIDDHVQKAPNVICYRRYVDDIVIVSSHEATAARPSTKTEVLGSLFPGFFSDGGKDRFVVPSTKEVFELKESKTRVHDLIGTLGLDFLGAVQQSFSVVTSERRAFLGNVERLAADIGGIDIFADGVAQTDHIPRLRDADRFTLRRYMTTAYVRGLQRSAQLLETNHASDFLKNHTQRMISLLDNSSQLEDFDLVISLLKVALLCSCKEVVNRLSSWLDRHVADEQLEHIEEITWRGQTLPREIALYEVTAYLERRVSESIASACALPGSTAATVLPQDKPTLKAAALLRRADLRHLDREDDMALFGAKINRRRIASPRKEHASALRAIGSDSALSKRLEYIRSFVARSKNLDENIWSDMSDISLLLSAKPPHYVDVARRFLARIEGRSRPPEDIGMQIDKCVDAFRGTRYRRRYSHSFTVSSTVEVRILEIEAEFEPKAVRVILSNLPVELEAFTAAASGHPLLTFDRLVTLDRALRNAHRAARHAKAKGLPSILVLPELSIPRRWVRALAGHAVREELSILAGIEYEATTGGLVNQAMGVFPLGRRMAAMVSWTKHHPARGETAHLPAGVRFRTFDKSLRRLVVDSVHGRIGVLICSEILEADALSALSGRIELLLVPAWNEDTPSFDHVVHAASSLLVHSFVCIANNAGASDSRIAAPIKMPRHERDWCRLVHRNENQVIWGDLPVAELRRFHEGVLAAKREYRPLPPGWKLGLPKN